MRVIALLPLAAMALAQSDSLISASSSASASISSVVASITSSMPSASMSPEQICVNACPDGEGIVACQARCVGVPSPSESQVNATNDCAAACPQGNGTQAETDRYASCLQGCISSIYLSNTQTSSAGRPSGSSTGASSSSTGGSRTSTSSGANASSTDGSSGAVKVLVSGTGLLGLFAAFLAL